MLEILDKYLEPITIVSLNSFYLTYLFSHYRNKPLIVIYQDTYYPFFITGLMWSNYNILYKCWSQKK